MPGYVGSVGLTGYIAPADTLDSYALQSEVFNRGGYRSVTDITERDAITLDRRKLGMLVYCFSDSTFYTLKAGLDNTDWEVANLGAGLSGIVINDNTSTVYNVKTTDRVILVKAFDDGAALELSIDGSDNFPDGWSCIIVDDWRTGNTGNGGTGIFNLHGYNGVSFRTFVTSGTNIFNVYPKQSFMLVHSNGNWFISYVEKEDTGLPNNIWCKNDGSGVIYLQPQTTAQNLPISAIINVGAFSKASGDGVADYILPTINYYNPDLYGAIYMIRHEEDSPAGSKENVRLLPDVSVGDDLYNSKREPISEIVLKPGETAILQAIYDDPMDWILIGKIGGSDSNDNWEDITSNSSTSEAGYYFVYGNNTELELTSSSENRRFKIKCVSGNSIIKADTGIIDGITQDINLSEGSALEIVAKVDNTYYIISEY